MVRRLPLLALACALAGCSAMEAAGERKKAENSLKALSLDYLDFQNANDGRPPTSADEMNKFVIDRGSAAQLRKGEVDNLTVRWGAKLDPKADDAKNRVLASGKKVGGKVVVMMQSGAVKWLPEAEFASAPKAEPVK